MNRRGSVPLVRLPTDGRAITALRHVLTNVSATGQLYQPVLEATTFASSSATAFRAFIPQR